MVDKDAVRSHFDGDYQKFYGRYLPDVKKTSGDEFQAKCPFHDDRNPSLNFNGKTGEYFCHGCGKKGHAFHFYARINSLDTKHDFGKVLAGIARDFGISNGQTALKLVKTYDYTDADGKLVCQVCRYEPKTFKQRRPNGNGGWSYDLKDTPRFLYRLPEVIKADEVLIVEGEKDVETARGLGFTATTSPMGARKWRDEYTPYLQSKSVVLIPDNDNEGREHMAQVGAAIRDKVKSLKWLDLPDVPSKGDLTDWAGNFPIKEEAAERLAILIENAREYHPPKKYTHEDAVIDSAGFRAIILPSRAVYLHPIIQESQIILVSGWRGTGKTWFAMSLVDAISRGAPFEPWEIRQPATCLYLDGEMAMGDIRNRLKALNLNEDRANPLYLYSDAYANHLGLSRANLVSESWRATMKRILITRGVKVFVIDNIASLAGGLDENSKRDWDPVNSWLIDLRFNGVTSILLHHTNKEGGQRGTSAREDNIDMSIILKHPQDYVPENGADFVLTFSKTRLPWEDLKHIQDMRFTLQQDETGLAQWSWGFMKAEIKQQVVQMLQEGLKGKEIAEQLGISTGRVSQIKGQIKQEASLGA
jgi:hypothetical protein